MRILEKIKPVKHFNIIKSIKFKQLHLEFYDKNFKPIKLGEQIDYLYIEKQCDFELLLNKKINSILKRIKLFNKIWNYKARIYTEEEFNIEKLKYENEKIREAEMRLFTELHRDSTL